MKKSQYHDLVEVFIQIKAEPKKTMQILRELTNEQKEYFNKFIGFWLKRTNILDGAGISRLTEIRYKID